MEIKHTNESLRAFEDWCIQTYKDGLLRSPLHLSRGNEQELIEIFKEINPQDWVFTTYRSHYHSLLKGVPEEWLKQWILHNKSIHVMNAEHKIVTSAIVGGHLSQAVGVAMAIKLQCRDYFSRYADNGTKSDEVPHVWVFCGDQTASLGVFNDCHKYAVNNDLPITFVIEDNGLSTDTPTKATWNMKEEDKHWYELGSPKIIYYKYKRELPHYGIGVFVDFDDANKPKEDRGF